MHLFDLICRILRELARGEGMLADSIYEDRRFCIFASTCLIWIGTRSLRALEVLKGESCCGVMADD